MNFFGDMVDYHFARDMHVLLKQDSLTAISGSNQEIPVDIEPPVYFMFVKADRPIETQFELVRKHTRRGVFIDFYFSVVIGSDLEEARINVEPMPGLI